jgi:uncharacterized membrane protein
MGTKTFSASARSNLCRAVDYSTDEKLWHAHAHATCKSRPKKPSFCGNAVCLSILEQKARAFGLSLPPTSFLPPLSFCLLATIPGISTTYFSLSRPIPSPHLSVSVQPKETKTKRRKQGNEGKTSHSIRNWLSFLVGFAITYMLTRRLAPGGGRKKKKERKNLRVLTDTPIASFCFCFYHGGVFFFSMRRAQ